MVYEPASRIVPFKSLTQRFNSLFALIAAGRLARRIDTLIFQVTRDHRQNADISALAQAGYS